MAEGSPKTQHEWVGLYEKEIPQHKNVLPVILNVAFLDAVEIGFLEGRAKFAELDAVLRDLWLHDETGDPEDIGYMRALESVAEHFGLGIDD